MQRDMDLARSILAEIANRADASDPQMRSIQIEGYSYRKVSVHIMLLAKGGLIEAIDASSQGELEWIPMRPTNEGYEFLEVSRDEEIWEKAKSSIRGMGGAFSLDAFRQLLVKLTSKTLDYSECTQTA